VKQKIFIFIDFIQTNKVINIDKKIYLVKLYSHNNMYVILNIGHAHQNILVMYIKYNINSQISKKNVLSTYMNLSFKIHEAFVSRWYTRQNITLRYLRATTNALI